MEFTTKQLSWIVVGAIAIGGAGYLRMTTKIEELDKRTAVIGTQLEQFQKQLDRIEAKISK